MMTNRIPGHLIERLPQARGRLTAEAPLAGITWFGVGGNAEVMFRPADEADLAQFLKALPHAVPVTLIGVGSNLLVRDGGIPGVVMRLGSTRCRSVAAPPPGQGGTARAAPASRGD